MNYRIRFFIILFLVVYGCSTTPPPRIENGRYINPKYKFSIELPEGWVQTDKMPDWAKTAIPIAKRSIIKTMFFNNDTNGWIALECEKTIFDLRALSDFKIREIFTDFYEKRKKEIKKISFIKDYSYEIYGPCYDYCLFAREEIYAETEFQKIKAEKRAFLHSCYGDDTCHVGIMLISDSKTFDENFQVYYKVTDSIQTEY